MTEREREIRKKVKSLRELSQCDVLECSKCKEDEAFFADERFLLSELDLARERAERAEAALEARWGRCSNCGAMSYQVWLDESANGGAG